MILSLATTAFAADTGSITIENATVGATYSIYKVFDLTYDGEGTDKVVSYTFTKTAENTALFDALVATGSPFTLTATSTADVYSVSTTETDGAVIGAWLKANVTLLKLTDTKVASAATVVFNPVDYGYYYVTSTLGTAITVNSAMPQVTVRDKNIKPTIEKSVEEDSSANYQDSNDAEIGETVNFKIVIKAYAGAQNYVLHDNLPAGLTLDAASIVVDGLTKDTHYTVATTGMTDDCDFEITFKQNYLDTITGTTTTPTEITITYSATVNGNAVIAGTGNINTAKLSYSADTGVETEAATTTTYVWDLDVLKYGNGDETKKLTGAKFVLLNSVKGKVATITDGKLVSWDTYTAGMDLTSYELTTDANGAISIDGLDADVYYLLETEAPAGYNKLTEAFEVTVQANTVNIAKINNQSGSVLPDTGGMGTTLFYILGGLLTVGALVLLVTKKRMNAA